MLFGYICGYKKSQKNLLTALVDSAIIGLSTGMVDKLIKEDKSVYEAFSALNEDKQRRVINAALEEFTNNGYKRASTNEIVKSAGIAKGMLFHYFNSKKELYFYLLDYSMRFLTDELYKRVDKSNHDFLERIQQASIFKIELYRQYPHMFGFVISAYYEESPEVRPEIEARYGTAIADAYSAFYNEMNLNCFKDGLDPKRAMNIIIWTMEGLGKQYESLLKDPGDTRFEPVIDDMNGYLEILRKTLYK